LTIEDERAHGLTVIYHIVPAGAAIDDPYAPPSLAQEGFVHCSYAEAVRESAALHFPAGAALEVLAIDPAGLPVEVAETPRGKMPHVRGPIPARAITRRIALKDFLPAS
jgi:uncharacterized protein (DUF952 family)